MNAAVRLRVALALADRDLAWLARASGLERFMVMRALDPTKRPQKDVRTLAALAEVLELPLSWVVADPTQRVLSEQEASLARACIDRLRDLSRRRSLDPRSEPNVRSEGRRLPQLAKVRGARSAYRILGESLIGFGLIDGDVAFVRPSPYMRHCVNTLVVCRLNESLYLKRLTVGIEGVVMLQSATARYDPIVVGPADSFELLGRVVLVLREF